MLHGLKKYFLQFPRYFQEKIAFFSGEHFVRCACSKTTCTLVFRQLLMNSTSICVAINVKEPVNFMLSWSFGICLTRRRKTQCINNINLCIQIWLNAYFNWILKFCPPERKFLKITTPLAFVSLYFYFHHFCHWMLI